VLETYWESEKRRYSAPVRPLWAELPLKALDIGTSITTLAVLETYGEGEKRR